jgi:transcriptional regulator with XRE-family HTH domain
MAARDESDFNKQAFLRKLGTHIGKVCQAQGYSGDRVNLEAGFSSGTMSKIVSGLVDPKATTLARIAETIGVPLSKLTEFRK